jgi:DNA-binding response OmpR family regulator
MRILLAEDDRTNARGITFVLKQAQMVADTAETGAEAIDLAKLYDYDAIIMDVMLPDAEGFDVVRRLRAMKNTAPILMLSAQSRAEHKIKGLQSGADDYLAKPFDQQELVNAVDQVRREVGQRYDLKDSGTEISLEDTSLTIITASDMTLDAVADVLRQKATKRNLSLKIFDFQALAKRKRDGIYFSSFNSSILW